MMSHEEIWESLQIDSKVYNVGDPLPEEKFDFYIQGASENNLYCSNLGIKNELFNC